MVVKIHIFYKEMIFSFTLSIIVNFSNPKSFLYLPTQFLCRLSRSKLKILFLRSNKCLKFVAAIFLDLYCLHVFSRALIRFDSGNCFTSFLRNFRTKTASSYELFRRWKTGFTSLNFSSYFSRIRPISTNISL